MEAVSAGLLVPERGRRSVTLLDLFTGNFTWLQLFREVLSIAVVAVAMFFVGYRYGRLFHYISTACFHGRHSQCRLRCKWPECGEEACKCRCHKGGRNG